MCTGIQLVSSDGAAIGARTLEFEQELGSQIIVVPAGTNYPAIARGSLPWTATYGAVGANAYRLPLLVEGLNEKGLSAGAFYFPGYASYTPVSQAPEGKALSPLEVVTWILTTCATLDEVSAKLSSVPVAAFSIAGQGPPPLHYLVRDPQGRSIVIEYQNEGTITISQDQIGVFTNSPPFDWQSVNLTNYINLSPKNVEESSVLRIGLTQTGQGSGLLGLPGDFTPPSRFVRAAFYAASAQPGKTALETVKQAFHILNLFDIPVGTVQGSSGEDHTEWTSVSDMKNLVFYIRTHNNQQVRYVEVLPALKAVGGKVLHLSLAQEEQYLNLTPTAS
ncbi:MAG TPA: choloylglycine hydrolase family protein, partial [Blastocatellia bacterium]|nr:choloylglycine hydrolase family protein [Blastocatellia bacterium]